MLVGEFVMDKMFLIGIILRITLYFSIFCFYDEYRKSKKSRILFVCILICPITTTLIHIIRRLNNRTIIEKLGYVLLTMSVIVLFIGGFIAKEIDNAFFQSLMLFIH